jgi:hypothetical protein
MSFASFNPSEFINEFETQSASNPPNNTNPFLIESSPSTLINYSDIERENNEYIRRLIIHQSIVQRLDDFIAKNQIPHIIFHGPSGSGKQTIVREFIHRIYSGDKLKMKTHVMTVNCSHGKGIQFIRDELKFFAKANAQTKSNIDGGKSSEFKVIMLLNAHHLTVDAQSALRRCIELFSYNTRFFIVVENKDKLLNPILSRFCDIFVPTPMIDSGVGYNLHQYVLSQQFRNLEDRNIFQYEPEFIAIFDSGNKSIRPLMEIVNSLYESGVSCLDLMEWVKTRREKWSETDYSRAVMRFYQIKPQFRCEKLLMIFMCNYLVGNCRS